VSDVKIVLLMVGMHLLAIGAAGALIVYALRGSDDDPPSGDDGSGGSRRPTVPRPHGGPPLASARPAQLRLREPGRLADAYERQRRRAREPRAPVRSSPGAADVERGL